MPALPWPSALRLRDPRDRVSVRLALAHVLVLVALPGLLVVALGLWWNANTISHRFVHRRLFRARAADDAFSLALSLLLGLPQRIWRQRHLAHHAGRPWRWTDEPGLRTECIAVALGWVALAGLAPGFLLSAYLPGFLLGLALCQVQGHYEHARRPDGGEAGPATSCHARWWNRLFLGDGYHAEHHAEPSRHFAELPTLALEGVRTSAWPPVLRWLEVLAPKALMPKVLDGLERLVLASPALQRVVLAAHRAPLQALLAQCGELREVTVVGGGLFPRSAILLRELLPAARITVLERDASHGARARAFLPSGVRVVIGVYAPGMRLDADLVVLPLALRGARERCYAEPAAPWVIAHDWLWRPRGRSARVAPWLCKRMNLIERGAVARRAAG